MHPPSEPRVQFDGQAQAYEARAGLPESIGREVASLIGEALPPRALVVDVGAGTGTIGRHLIAQAVTYLGVDRSRAMLAEFARGLPHGARALLLRADADEAWPMSQGSAGLILFSRLAHLLAQGRALGEVRRIGAPGCRVFLGRVRRDRQSAGQQMKRAMQRLLDERGLPGKNGERARRDFLDALVAHGARALLPRASSSWTVMEAPIESIRAWQGKDGLGGRVVPDAIKRQILDALERWAVSELGDVTAPRAVACSYELKGVQLAE